MAYEVTRVYKNAAGDSLRIDTIHMRANSNALTTGVAAKTYYRSLTTTWMYEPVDRDVASFQLVTNADTVELVSGDYTYVHWTGKNNGVTVRCEMSDLPGVGDTV